MVFWPDFVIVRVGQQLFFGELPIEDSKPANRQSSHYDVESLIHPWIIEVGSCEAREEAEVVEWQHENDVFVEHIENEVAVSAVGFSTMAEQQILEEFELTN